MNKKASVRFHFLIPYSLKNRELLKAFIRSIFQKEKTLLAEINIIFCDDEYLLELNKKFLRHDFYTDILSFPLSAPKQPLVAEIYISLHRVRENARNVGNSVNNELHRVIFHGILHFCGYKDKSIKQIDVMRKLEDKYLKAYL